MIRGMVERLAERLKTDKSDLQGWLMLIRSYAVLKETDKAKAAMTAAREQFASDASALEQIDAITKELSFAFAPGNPSAPHAGKRCLAAASRPSRSRASKAK